jgi:hypothetical protein
MILQLEEIQVLPSVVDAGKEINQRIRYALCLFTHPKVLRGSITRTIVFKGTIMMHDVTNYEFKPGTWIVDIFIGIPEEAKSGIYMLNIALKYENEMIKASGSFVVKGKQ